VAMTDLSDLFDKAYGQERVTNITSTTKGYRKNRQIKSEKYNAFLRKYDDLEKYISSFTTSDLTYFFREKAHENGSRYSISNMKRDMGIFKALLQEYSSFEICSMIEFLFTSGQKYLKITTLQPTVLSSNWRNTIFNDTMLWLDDKFNPNKKSEKIKRKPVSRNQEREWQKGKKQVKMGEWGE
jgi:hypothetical protein